MPPAPWPCRPALLPLLVTAAPMTALQLVPLAALVASGRSCLSALVWCRQQGASSYNAVVAQLEPDSEDHEAGTVIIPALMLGIVFALTHAVVFCPECCLFMCCLENWFVYTECVRRVFYCWCDRAVNQGCIQHKLAQPQQKGGLSLVLFRFLFGDPTLASCLVIQHWHPVW